MNYVLLYPQSPTPWGSCSRHSLLVLSAFFPLRSHNLQPPPLAAVKVSSCLFRCSGHCPSGSEKLSLGSSLCSQKKKNNLCLCRWIGLSAVVVMCPIVPSPFSPCSSGEVGLQSRNSFTTVSNRRLWVRKLHRADFVSHTKCVCLLSLLQCAHKITA